MDWFTDWLEKEKKKAQDRKYRHFDNPYTKDNIGQLVSFAQQLRNDDLRNHPFFPLIKREFLTKRFSVSNGFREIKSKSRLLFYASHKDSVVLSYYAAKINNVTR